MLQSQPAILNQEAEGGPGVAQGPPEPAAEHAAGDDRSQADGDQLVDVAALAVGDSATRRRCWQRRHMLSRNASV